MVGFAAARQHIWQLFAPVPQAVVLCSSFEQLDCLQQVTIAHLQNAEVCRQSLRAKGDDLQRWSASPRASRCGSWLPRAVGGLPGRVRPGGGGGGGLGEGGGSRGRRATRAPELSARRRHRTSRGWRSSELAVGPPSHEPGEVHNRRCGCEELELVPSHPSRGLCAAGSRPGASTAAWGPLRSGGMPRIWAQEGGDSRGRSRMRPREKEEAIVYLPQGHRPAPRCRRHRNP
jgi:hypothetical protein